MHSVMRRNCANIDTPSEPLRSEESSARRTGDSERSVAVEGGRIDIPR